MFSHDAVVFVEEPTPRMASVSKEKPIVTTEEVLESPESPSGVSARPWLARANTSGTALTDDRHLTPAGRALYILLENPIVRYMIYILPVAAILAIPLILFATVWPNHRADGIRLLGIFIYVEVIWVSLWIAKLVAGAIPYIFQGVCGIISTGIRKYALVLRAVEIPLSLFIWTIMALCWLPIIWVFDQDYYNARAGKIAWLKIMYNLCRGSIISSAILLIEKTLMQLISVNYHGKQYSDKIKEIKQTTRAMDLLYAASLRRYPDHSPETIEEDYDIHDTTNMQKFLKQNSADRSVLRAFGDIHYFGEKLVSAFGKMASEVTGTEVMKPTATHAVVEAALERRAGAEALAKRIFKSLVSPTSDHDAIHLQDIVEELGPGYEEQAAWIFAQLDRDENGDVSLEEMTILVTGVSRQRKDMWRSACNIRDAIRVLDRVLSFFILLIVALIYSSYFSTFLANNLKNLVTLLSASAFSFGQTVGEFNAACIQVFIKHPFDVGDRINMSGNEYEVVRISLLYTVFRRIDSDTIVQVANNVVGGLFIDNISRSKAMKERYQFSVFAGTSFADLEKLRGLLEEWVRSPDNSRDFQPDVDIQLLSVGDLKQLDLRVEIKHKSNWANDSLRAYRRSKFMCALLSAMRKVPIDSPGGVSAGAGSMANPSYTVEISQTEAQEAKDKFAADKEARRMPVEEVIVSEATAGQTSYSSALEVLPNLSKGFQGNDRTLGLVSRPVGLSGYIPPSRD